MKIPTNEDIEKTTFGNYREPSAMRAEIDFCHFINDIMNKSLAHFAKFVKDYTGGRLLVGAPAGYALIGEHPLTGHSCVADIMKIKDIDIIVCPASYFHRRLDNVSASQSAMDSSRMAAFFDHKGGVRKISMPKKCKLTEVYTGETHNFDGAPIKLIVEPDECKFFIIE